MDDELIKYDYFYSLHSMLMTALSTVNPDLAKELHDGEHRQKIKMWGFSALSSTPKPKRVNVNGEKRDRMLLGQRVYFRINSPWPELLFNLCEALTQIGEIRILNKTFRIKEIKMISAPKFKETMVWRCFGQASSITTSWTPKGSKDKKAIYPDSTFEGYPSCEELIRKNLYHKFQRLHEVRDEVAIAWLRNTELDAILEGTTPIEIAFLPVSEQKAYNNSSQLVKNNYVRSWRCPVKITALIPIQRLIWSTGLGSLNSQGFGLMQEGKDDC
ncbi:MAG: hypothetical protein HRT88_11635 [Lentisphaeraceae bacterium]|nr:hypothetical protein [Lentisphaeraceae bacterium]